MFHAARALLYRDGYREKSHYCIARYLEEKHVQTGRLPQIVVDLIDRFRELRHEDLYELEYSATREDAEEALENAKLVITYIKRILMRNKVG